MGDETTMFGSTMNDYPLFPEDVERFLAIQAELKGAYSTKPELEDKLSEDRKYDLRPANSLPPPSPSGM